MRARAPTQAPEWEEVCPKQRDTASKKARAAQFAERSASKRKDARKLIKVEERSRLQKRKKVTFQAEEREEMNDRKERARKYAERTTLKQRKAIREHRNREDE